jgi:hypothetical protein
VRSATRRGCHRLARHYRSGRARLAQWGTQSCFLSFAHQGTCSFDATMQANRILQNVKSAWLSDQEKVGTIWLGVFRGVKTIAVPRDSLQIRLGLWERETHKYIKRAAVEARWFIDIGAGSGELSIFFATRTNANPIIAVEPWNMRFLRDNIGLNGSISITVLDQYLGLEENCIRLDSLDVPRHERGFIKLDADFAELSILKSGERLLAQGRPLLLVETHSAALERDCCAFLHQLGYQTKIIPNAWWRLLVPEQRPLDHNRWLWAEPNC